MKSVFQNPLLFRPCLLRMEIAIRHKAHKASSYLVIWIIQRVHPAAHIIPFYRQMSVRLLDITFTLLPFLIAKTSKTFLTL